MENNKHYICTGGCDGMSDVPGVCQAEDCPDHGKALKECDCTDGAHDAVHEKENKESGDLQKAGGFIALPIIYGIISLIVIVGGVTIGFKEFKKFSKELEPSVTTEEPQPAVQEETKPVVNPFPVKPSEKPAELPKEPVGRDVRIGGTPIIPPPAPAPVTATGEWHGRFTVTAPPECANESGGWEANLTETTGTISGNFTTDVGISGAVNGTRSGDTADWGIGGGGGRVSFKGAIQGHTMSGTFTGLICNKNPEKQRSTGTYFGGRIAPVQ